MGGFAPPRGVLLAVDPVMHTLHIDLRPNIRKTQVTKAPPKKEPLSVLARPTNELRRKADRNADFRARIGEYSPSAEPRTTRALCVPSVPSTPSAPDPVDGVIKSHCAQSQPGLVTPAFFCRVGEHKEHMSEADHLCFTCSPACRGCRLGRQGWVSCPERRPR